MAPGWEKRYHIGVRASQSRKLVAFISAIPVNLNVRGKTILCSEVNFLCVHKKLRGKRLAPVLIKEITRVSNLDGVWQGLFTAGIVLPKPISTCRYFHRALDWQKLYECGFSPLPPGSKPQFQVRKYTLPTKTSTKGLRPIKEEDLEQVLSLQLRYNKRYEMSPEFSMEEARHWFIPNVGPGMEQVIWTYVVEVSFWFAYYNTTLTGRRTRTRRSRISSPSSPSSPPSLAIQNTVLSEPHTYSTTAPKSALRNPRTSLLSRPA